MLTVDKERVYAWVQDRIGDTSKRGCQAAIGVLDGDNLVAGIVYDHYTKACVTVSLAIEKKKLPRQMVRAMFDYGFNQLGAKKAIVYVAETNKDSLNIAKRFGFELEAKIEDVYPDGAMLIMGLPKANCKWLGV